MSTDVLTERYGAAPTWRRRAWVIAAAVVVLLFAGWLVWVVSDQTSPQVTSELEGFTFPDEHTARAVLVVDLADDGVVATCRLRAYAEDHTVVGEANLTPDPALGRRQVKDIRTERRATSVETLGCTAPGQTHPR